MYDSSVAPEYITIRNNTSATRGNKIKATKPYLKLQF